MSYAVVRGEPYAAQHFMDNILDELLVEGVSAAGDREGVNLPQILFYCLRKNPDDVFMINGATGEKITNAQILKRAVSVARAMLAKRMRGKYVLVVMRNHQTMAAMYFAVQFAGVVPFIVDPNSTAFEISHFIKLVDPCMVFCDEEQFNNVNTALRDIPGLKTEVKVSNREELLEEFADGFSDEPEGFQIPDVDLDDTVMMLPTSGSTGLPKAALMSHRGLVVQIPMTWSYHTQFPTPTYCCMLLTTPQWVTFTMTLTSCIMYRVPVLMSQNKPTVEWVKEMLVTFRPSWTFFGPAFVKSLLPAITKDHLSSLKTLNLLGAPSSIELMTDLRDMLPSSANLGNVYGTTEGQGYITTPFPGVPLKSTGYVVNIFDYMLVDDEGSKVGPCQSGELLVKGCAIIKGYHKNQGAFEESFTDGWFKTGDLFYADESERLFYLERKKFCFKFQGCHVSPEEVELVIGSVPGVEECVICPTESGPAAIVVVHSTCSVTREQIHKAVNDTLSDHKRLHGGIAFVVSLPHTHSGKIKREDCKKLIQDLISAGKCY